MWLASFMIQLPYSWGKKPSIHQIGRLVSQCGWICKVFHKTVNFNLTLLLPTLYYIYQPEAYLISTTSLSLPYSPLCMVPAPAPVDSSSCQPIYKDLCASYWSTCYQLHKSVDSLNQRTVIHCTKKTQLFAVFAQSTRSLSSILLSAHFISKATEKYPSKVDIMCVYQKKKKNLSSEFNFGPYRVYYLKCSPKTITYCGTKMK